MAVADTKSTLISNPESRPTIATDFNLDGGRVRKKVFTVEVAAADDDNSVYRLCRLPSRCHVHSIKFQNDTITGGTDYNLGLYDTDENGGAAVDDNCFADALDLSSALAWAEQAYENRDIDDINQKLWEVAGASEDPEKDYELALIGITVGSGAGTISGIVEYTDE